MSTKNIAIVCGGYSGEYEVSLRSAEGILPHIDRDLYTPYIVSITHEEWSVRSAEGEVGTIGRDFVAHLPSVGEVRFDFAYITIHGVPGEDGPLQGYFDLLQIPYSTGGVLPEAVTFNKEVCNAYLAHYGHRIARSRCLRRAERIAADTVDVQSSLRLPLFVKPNTGGSSIATTRVDTWEQLATAIERAYSESPEVLVEECIVGTEVTCGCVITHDRTFALPVTEVVAHGTFFDFDAKYKGESDEITPARISDELTTLIQETTQSIGQLLRCHGIIRVDYIVEADGRPTLLEVNTTPGMTPQSFIPQQVRAAGLTLKEIFTQIIQSKLR